MLKKNNKDETKQYNKTWNKIKYLTGLDSNGSDKYVDKYMKIKFK